MRLPSLFAAAPAGLFAQGALAQAKSGTEANPLLGHLTQSALWLIVIVALLLAFSYLMKRINPQAVQKKLMRTVVTHSLGARERVTIVEFQGNWLVIGSTPNSVNLLHITAKPERGIHASDQGATTSGFATHLKSLLERRSNV